MALSTTQIPGGNRWFKTSCFADERPALLFHPLPRRVYVVSSHDLVSDGLRNPKLVATGWKQVDMICLRQENNR